MNVVVDTNTLVSGFLWSGTPARFLDAGLDSKFTIFTSPELLEELESTLSAPKFQQRLASKGLTPSDLVSRFRSACHEVTPIDIEQPDKLRDPDDLAILSCAAAVPADLIVTGDKDLLVLGDFRGIPIMDPTQELEFLGLS